MNVRQLVTGLSIAVAVVVSDLATKRYAATNFKSDPIEVIPGVLDFVYTENFGSAFSLFQSIGTVASIAAIVAAIAVTVALTRDRPTIEVVAFGLIGGGAVGNLVDRLSRGDGLFDGGVIDWIALPNFPVFNIADSAITVAVVLLLVWTWRTERAEKRAEQPSAVA